MKTRKVLVANRSEIACRVFQTCREMGLKTIAIVAPGDEEARHVTYADEVREVKGYLDVDSVLGAAQHARADLIHPGYGFLSERPHFVRAVEAAGIIFIGPRPDTMELLGGKIQAKELANKVKVPTLPWALAERGADLKKIAKKVGFPLLLKASSGGGGKGMRKVEKAEDLDAAAESASAEALAAFGDGTLFLERLVERPRHIEVQIFGDGQGNGVHLYERECTLQRRHQKIWEEARAPHLSDEVREQLYESALKLVRASKYRNAGTVEFLVNDTGEYYFLEMNTRLQVEHPVTESITGIDLVRTQLEQALKPKELALKEVPVSRGHAIEVRFYAEDPAQQFIPTPGTIEKLKWPTGTGIRIESGIEEGQLIGTQFDSMLGKLIVTAGDRNHSIERLRFALEETVILGLGTNQNYLRALTENPKVKQGLVDTHFLEREFSSTYMAQPSDEALTLLTLALSQPQAHFHLKPTGESSSDRQFPSPWNTGGFEVTGGAST